MDIIRGSLWLANQAFDALSHIWQVSVFLILTMAACVTYDSIRHKLTMDTKIWSLLLPLVGTAAILMSGAIFQLKPQYEMLTRFGFGISLALSAANIKINRSAWRTAVAIDLFICWYSLWCSFVAGMSITGNWI
jgi:hypothetical protein